MVFSRVTLLLFFFVVAGAHAVEDCVKRDPLGWDQNKHPGEKYMSFQYAQGPTFKVSQDQLRKTLDRINARIQVEVDTDVSERRLDHVDGQFKQSYCLFHPAGDGGREILGTVLLFHGFSNRPEQMSKLASYLFHSGYNIYNVFLSRHYKAPGSKFWPKLLYRLDQLHNINNTNIDPTFAAKVQRIYEKQEPELFAQVFETGVRDQGGQAFDGWITDAKERLAQLDDLPGPVYVVGLSLGSAIALRLGVEDGGRRIKGIVAHGPYLQEKGEDRRKAIKFFGPVGMQNQVLNKQEFSGATAAAQHYLANSLFLDDKLTALANVPTFMVMTDSDDSADTGRTKELQQKLVEKAGDRVKHLEFTYDGNAHVGHAMTDPRDYEENDGRRNFRYKALYQETLDFFVNQKIDGNHLYQHGLRGDLPKVENTFDNY